MSVIDEMALLIENTNIGEQLFKVLSTLGVGEALNTLGLTEKNILNKTHKAFKACLIKNSEDETLIVALALLAFKHLEKNNETEYLPLRLYLISELARYNDIFLAKLILNDETEKAFALSGEDIHLHTRATLWIEEINGALRRSEGGKKGGGQNRELDPQTVLDAYNKLTAPEHNRASILAKRFNVTPRTIRNALKEALKEA